MANQKTNDEHRDTLFFTSGALAGMLERLITLYGHHFEPKDSIEALQVIEMGNTIKDTHWGNVLQTIDPNDGWIKIADDKSNLPAQPCWDVLGFHTDWIDEDFNPTGIRICNFTDDKVSICARWCNYHDQYENEASDEEVMEGEDEPIFPTHYKLIGNGPKLK